MVTGVTHAQTNTGVQKLADLRDRARPVLIFAPNSEDPQLQAQLKVLHEHAAEARDRDVLPVALPSLGSSPTEVDFANTEREALRRRFHIHPAQFVVILIGKDGGEKLRSTTPFSMEKLISTIDAMPMRQDEVRERPHHEPDAGGCLARSG